MTESKLQVTLREHFLFSALPESAREALYQRCRMVELKNDETLFHQGDLATSFYVVLTGSINLYRVAPDGQTKVIEVIRAGAAFAEALMFMDEMRYPLSSIAMGRWGHARLW